MLFSTQRHLTLRAARVDLKIENLSEAQLPCSPNHEAGYPGKRFIYERAMQLGAAWLTIPGGSIGVILGFYLGSIGVIWGLYGGYIGQILNFEFKAEREGSTLCGRGEGVIRKIPWKLQFRV